MVNNRNMRYYGGNNGNNNSGMNGNMNSSCDCQKSCDELKKKLMQVDFAIVETVLYLDAYPECRAALDYFCELKEKREMLAEAVNEKCGPITARENNCTCWEWVKTPWPWELDAN